jgi:hypothetical protein
MEDCHQSEKMPMEKAVCLALSKGLNYIVTKLFRLLRKFCNEWRNQQMSCLRRQLKRYSKRPSDPKRFLEPEEQTVCCRKEAPLDLQNQ